ncbi:unnamed protein product [Prunus armeniaca]
MGFYELERLGLRGIDILMGCNVMIRLSTVVLRGYLQQCVSQEGFAFAHCTTCKAPYHLRVHVIADRKWLFSLWFPAILASSCMVYLNVWASFTFVWNTKKHLTQRVQNLDDKLLEQKEISKSILENIVTCTNSCNLKGLNIYSTISGAITSGATRAIKSTAWLYGISCTMTFHLRWNSVLYLRMKRCADRGCSELGFGFMGFYELGNNSHPLSLAHRHCSQKEVKKKESKKRFKTISMTKKFSCRPKDLFEILMDENRWKNGSLIVQIWRFGSWPDGIDSTICQVFFFLVRLKLEEPEPGLTIVKLTHSDIPEEDRYGNATVVENTERGWRDLIFQRIRAVFGFGICDLE